MIIESVADKVHAALLALGYSGATLDMMYTYLGDEGYTGSLPDRWYQYSVDNGLIGLPTEQLAAAFEETLAGIAALSNGLFYYNIQDLSKLFQDAAGTTPAAIGSPVGLIVDSGTTSSNNAVQSTAAARPVLRQDVGGNYYLEHDGVDDKLIVTFDEAPGNCTLIFAGPDEITTLWPLNVGLTFEVHTGGLYALVLVNHEVTASELGSSL